MRLALCILTRTKFFRITKLQHIAQPTSLRLCVCVWQNRDTYMSMAVTKEQQRWIKMRSHKVFCLFFVASKMVMNERETSKNRIPITHEHSLCTHNTEIIKIEKWHANERVCACCVAFVFVFIRFVLQFEKLRNPHEWMYELGTCIVCRSEFSISSNGHSAYFTIVFVSLSTKSNDWMAIRWHVENCKLIIAAKYRNRQHTVHGLALKHSKLIYFSFAVPHCSAFVHPIGFRTHTHTHTQTMPEIYFYSREKREKNPRKLLVCQAQTTSECVRCTCM